MQQTINFFRAMYRYAPQDLYMEFRLIHEKKGFTKRLHRRIESLEGARWETLVNLNREFHVYHRSALSDQESGSKHDLTHTVALFIDIDENTAEHYRRIEVGENAAFKTTPPSAVIGSGGGFHCYWFLRTPINIAGNQDTIGRIERTTKGLIYAYGEGADTAVHDVSRIMRTPGFYNIKAKYSRPVQCKALYLDEPFIDTSGYEVADGYYEFDHLFKKFAPLAPAPQSPIRRSVPQEAYNRELPRWIQDYLRNGVSIGERNVMLFKVAAEYKDRGYTQADAKRELMARGESDGLSKSECERTIHSAFNRPRQVRIRNANIIRAREARLARLARKTS